MPVYRSPMRHTRLWISALVLLTIAAGACATTANFAGLTGQEIYDRSLEYLNKEDWDNAVRGFETLLYSYPTFPQAAEARLHMADAYFGKEQYLSAASEYERVLTQFPDDSVAPIAALGMCRSHVALSPIVQRDQEYTRQAIQSCSTVLDEFAGTEQAQRATALRDSMVAKLAEKDYERGSFYFDRNLYDSALIFLQDVLERYPHTPAAPKALLRIYQSYVEIGYSEEAEAARQRLLTDYPDSPAAQEVRAGSNGQANAQPDDGGGGGSGKSGGRRPDGGQVPGK